VLEARPTVLGDLTDHVEGGLLAFGLAAVDGAVEVLGEGGFASGDRAEEEEDEQDRPDDQRGDDDQGDEEVLVRGRRASVGRDDGALHARFVSIGHAGQHTTCPKRGPGGARAGSNPAG
jgi:hypothetical protein